MEQKEKSKATSKSKGWVKLHREELGLPMFENPNLWKVWTWCRLKATHTKRKTKVPNHWGKPIEVELEAGEFIVGKYRAARDLGMAPSTFHDQMLKLQELGEIILEPDRTHTLVTITNWSTYQGDGKMPDRTPEGNGDDTKDMFVAPTALPQKSDRTPRNSRPHSGSEKTGNSKKLQGKKKKVRPHSPKSPTALPEIPDTIQEGNNKNELDKTKRKTAPLRGDHSEEVSTKKKSKKSKKSKKENYSDGEHPVCEFSRNLKIATEAARRNRERLGVAPGEGPPLHVEIAERLWTPAVQKESAEAGVMEEEENLRQERRQKMAEEVPQ